MSQIIAIGDNSNHVCEDVVKHVSGGKRANVRSDSIVSNTIMNGNEGSKVLCTDSSKPEVNRQNYAHNIEKCQDNVEASLGTGSSASQVKSSSLENQPPKSVHVVSKGDSNVGYHNKIILAHETIKKSGVHNYKGCRIPVKTKLNIEFLELVTMKSFDGFKFSLG